MGPREAEAALLGAPALPSISSWVSSAPRPMKGRPTQAGGLAQGPRAAVGDGGSANSENHTVLDPHKGGS